MSIISEGQESCATCKHYRGVGIVFGWCNFHKKWMILSRWCTEYKNVIIDKAKDIYEKFA